jgi:hypothetical protein
VKSGFGVVADDLAAGAWAALAYTFLALGLRLLLGCQGGGFWCLELTP